MNAAWFRDEAGRTIGCLFAVALMAFFTLGVVMGIYWFGVWIAG